MDFSKAEFGAAAVAAKTCANCGAAVTGQYWTVGTAMVCGTCAKTFTTEPSSDGAVWRVMKALGAGCGAGLLGAAGYSAIIHFMDMELALVTIFIGWFVGRGVRWGSEGRGGRGYQVMGAVLTFVWCMQAYVPTLVVGMTKADPPIHWAVALALAPFLAFLVPFSGDVSPIGLLILVFGVWRGWREPAAVKVQLEGPFELTAQTAVVVDATPTSSSEPSAGG